MRAPDINDTLPILGLLPAAPEPLHAGRYEILGLLGVGGMGNVYRARDNELGELIAIKMLRPDLARAPGMIDAFRREVRLARKVSHPNVARTFDIGSTATEKFLTMELIEGETFGALVDRAAPLELDRVVPIIDAVCAGLAAAHDAGIVHQDLKPDNVMLARNGRIVIMDFGIARALAEGAVGGSSIVGTPAYMSPEQVAGAAMIDGAADIYALGAMLFECVTGKLPFEGSSAMAMAAARLLHAPPDPRTLNPELSPEVAAIILKCLARAPSERYRSAREVAAALDKLHLGPSLPRLRAASAEVAPRRVAILPALARNPADSYLADGLASQIVELLAGVPGLHVPPHGVTSHLAAREHDPRAVGAALGVDVVLHGVLESEGPSRTLRVQLLAVNDGVRLWTLEREVGADLGDLVWTIAAAVAERLDAPAPPPAPRVIDRSAFDLYLKGRYLYHRFAVGRNAEAIEALEQAHRLAPDSPAVATGFALAVIRGYALGAPAEQVTAAQELLERVLESDARSPEARLGLAVLYLQRNESVAGAEQLRKCLAVAPELADALDWKGRLLLEVGPIDEGLRALEEAATLEPHLAHVNAYVARGLALLGDWEAAKERLMRFNELGDDELATHGGAAARLAFWMGDRAFLSQLERRFATVAAGGRARWMMTLITDAMSGSARDAGERLRSIRHASNAPRSLTFFAQRSAEHYGAEGLAEETLRELHEADSLGLVDLSWLERCPLLACTRDLPQYAALHARVAGRAERVRVALG